MCTRNLFHLFLVSYMPFLAFLRPIFFTRLCRRAESSKSTRMLAKLEIHLCIETQPWEIKLFFRPKVLPLPLFLQSMRLHSFKLTVLMHLRPQPTKMEEAIRNWVAENEQKIAVKFSEIGDEVVKMEVNGYPLQLIIPCDEESTFVALPMDNEVGGSLNEELVLLNEKLERLRLSQQECYTRALDCIVQALFHRKSTVPSSYICKIAAEANLECRNSLLNDNDVDTNALAWCSVSADPTSCVVKLLMDVRGLLYESEEVGRALGFPFDGTDLIIKLQFNQDVWEGKKTSCSNTGSNYFRILEIYASTCYSTEQDFRAFNYRDFPTMMLQYGPQRIVPEIVKEFLDSDYLEKENGNIFVALLSFIGSSLKDLKNHCVMCKEKLPQLSRLWYCDAELCLYKFEELGIGVSVLQELQNTEVVEFEISTALVAASSSRNVFEPYPTFLLKRREIRKRSGFFCEHKLINSQSSSSSDSSVLISSRWTCMDNKEMDLLTSIILSFPPVKEMQTCKTEIDLLLKLKSSLKNLNYSDSTTSEAEHIWLPYSLLRYILFTNRLVMKPLQHCDRLPVPESHLQLVIYYDSEKEKIFDIRREREGSIFAFHGSASCNWYSIIRNGLRSLSKTSYMSSGMACGEGIYFSTNCGTSLRYSSPLRLHSGEPFPLHYSSTSQRLPGEPFSAMVVAICEIIRGGECYKSGDVLVVPPKHENDVAIRYLIVTERHSNCQISQQGGKTCILGKIDLLEHYTSLREQYVNQKMTDVLSQRQRCEDLLQNRRMKVSKS